MGYGIILGGGGVALNYSYTTASSYANLPSNAQANTIGLITATSVPQGGLIFKNGDISGMASGSVAIRVGSNSSTAFNIVKDGTVEIYPTGAYQYSGTLWVPITAYVFINAAWTLMKFVVYELGSIPVSIGDLLVYKFAGTDAVLTKGSDYFSFVTGSSNTRAWAYTQYPIDLTNITTLHAYMKVGSLSSWWGVSPAYNSTSSIVYTTVSDMVYTDKTLDVSALSGNYYVFWGKVDAVSNRTHYVQRCWGI